MTLMSWILHYWDILVWVILLLVGAGLIRFYLGSRFSLPALIAGLSFIIFLLGKKIERDNQRKSVQDILDKREKAYEEIDSRNTSASDAARRLRDGSY